MMQGEARRSVAETLAGDADPKVIEQAEVLDIALGAWEEQPKPWKKVLAVEQEMEKNLGPLPGGAEDLWVFGRPDAIVEWRDGWWHVQHKTLAGSKPIPVFSRGVQVSLHEGIYAGLLRENLRDMPVYGTMLNVVRKLSRGTVSKNPRVALHIEFIPIPAMLVHEAEQDVRAEAARIYAAKLSAARPTRNRENCTGRYGNSLCTYYGQCWQGQPQTALQQIDPLAGYKQTAVD